MLKNGRAIVKSTKPYFVIQLIYETTNFVQPTILKVDSGYKYIGVSAVTPKKEVLLATIDLLDNIKKRLEICSKYRRTRRNRLRYRKPRFNNRKACR